MTTLRSGDATDVGRVRENNQDLALVSDDYVAVADGMGGHSGGETAARIAIDTLADRFSDGTLDALVGTVEFANERVVSEASADPDLRGMGTTLCVLAAVTHDDTDVIGVVNVGDSRAYLVDGDELVQVTKDHTLVQMLVDQGQLRADEAEYHPQRNILTRALGIDARVMVDSYLLHPVAGDRYLICSDGLYGEVDDATILAVLQAEPDPAEAARRLVDAANEAGGHDNITCVVVDVTDGPDDEFADADRVIESETGQHRAVAAAASDATADGAPSEHERGEEDEEPGVPDAGPDELPESGGESGDAEAAPVGESSDGAHLGIAAPVAVAPAPPVGGERPRRFTWRTGLFLAMVLVVLALAVGATAFYARSTYFVGEQSGQIVIFRGRPGGVLWFAPTIEDTTELSIDDLPPALRREVEDGKDQPTLSEADQYIANLREQIERIEADRAERDRSSSDEPPDSDDDTGPSTTDAPAVSDG